MAEEPLNQKEEAGEEKTEIYPLKEGTGRFQTRWLQKPEENDVLACTVGFLGVFGLENRV